jgi:hypothetical protein
LLGYRLSLSEEPVFVVFVVFNAQKSHLGKDLFNYILITLRIKDAKTKETETVAEIKIERSKRPVWIKYQDEHGNKKTEFYIRTGNGKELLEGQEQHEYIKAHWKT